MKNLNRIGMALEGFGATITGCGIGNMSQAVLLTGVLISAAGRALTLYAKS